MAGTGLRRCSATLAIVATLVAVTACDFSGPAPRAELLANATVPTGVVSPHLVRLHHGRDIATSKGITTETTLLHPRAHGDADGDGVSDTAALVQTRARLADSRQPSQARHALRDTSQHNGQRESPGAPTSAPSVTFVSVVIFRNVNGAANGGTPTVTNALPLGPGARVHGIDIVPAELRRHSPPRATPARLVVDYTLPEAALTQQPHRQRLTAKLTGGVLALMDNAVATEVDTAAAVKPTQLTLASGTDTGVVAYGATQHYEFTVNAGHRVALDATSSQPGVRIGLQGADGTVLMAAESGEHSFHGTAPKSQRYRLDVSSDNERPARYTLKAMMAKPRPVSAAVPGRAGGGKVLHLTFDDGPHIHFTDRILEILAKYSAKATFFVVGKNIVTRPGWVERTLAAGHVVSNHSYTHRKLAGVSQQTFDDEVGRTQLAIGPRAAACLRPPYGAVDAQLRQRAANLGLTTVLWDVDTRDWRREPPEEIAKRIIDGAQSGNIVLMHDGGGDRSNTVQALEIALPKLVGQGWSFAPVCG